MHPTHDDNHDEHRPMTEADRTSETRFGPRPVPPGHRYPQSRRTIPSGRVSPDGRSAYPAPSLGAKIAVWGGVALGVAGGTAAAVFAARKIAEAIAGDSGPRPRGPQSSAPRFAQMDPEEREAMRRRVRAQDREDRQEVARLRAEASQHRQPHPVKPGPVKPSSVKPTARKGNFVDDVIQTSTRLSESLEGVVKSLCVTMDGFRSVARQANEVISEFSNTADQFRQALKGDTQAGSRRDADDSDRNHRL